MKSRDLACVVLLIGLVSLANISAQTPTPRRRSGRVMLPRPAANYANQVEFDLCYQFSVPGDTARIRFITLLPGTIPGKQNILSVNYSRKPSRIFSRNGNHYAEFIFVEPRKRFEVKINVKAELFRYDLSLARMKREKGLSKGAALDEFLKRERYIEKDHSQIQRIAKGIKGRDEIDTVKKIYEYVIDNMEYAGLSRKELGAVKAAQEKKGDCSEYSELFVALCRAKDIPARVATGYLVRFDNVPPKHHWAEVYLQKHGWVPFDPTSGDVESSVVRNRAFETMKPVYVYLSHIHNDRALYNNHYYSYMYRGDKATLKDSVEFKRPASSFDKTH